MFIYIYIYICKWDLGQKNKKTKFLRTISNLHYLEHQLQAVVDLALTCTEEDPQTRPTMVDVTKQLRRIERFVWSVIIYSLDFIQSYVIDKQIHIIAYPNVLGMTTNKIYSLDFQTKWPWMEFRRVKKADLMESHLMTLLNPHCY